MKPKINDQILFDLRNSVVDAVIVSETEKAVKIDLGINPIGSYGIPTVYNKTMWIPKSILIYNNGYFTVKSWFADKFTDQTKYSIKPYYIKYSDKVYL